MFSLGAIYYQILYGKPLFVGKDQREVLMNNRFCQTHCPEKEGAGYGEIDLLRSMLVHEPALRTSPQQALQSHFLKESKEIRCRAFRNIEPSKK